MDCERTQDLLSAYLDGELIVSADAAMTSHLAHCDRCRDTCHKYDRLRALVAEPQPIPAVNEIWNRISHELSLVILPRNPRRSILHSRWLILAAMVLLAATVAIPLATLSRLTFSSNGELADLFDSYLEQFEQSPEAAQSFIDAAYPTLVLSADSTEPSFAASVLRTRKSLPGMTLVEYHLHRLPCCNCIQGLYRRDDGTLVSVFEHTEPTEWDAHQKPKRVQCGECICRVTQASGQVVATWEHHSHTFTVIGIEDERELALLVSKL